MNNQVKTPTEGILNEQLAHNDRAGAKAVVLLSGGLDSATVLAYARSQGYECYCLSLDYHQRHIAELNAAKNIAAVMGAAAHKTAQLDLSLFGGSALTDEAIAVPKKLRKVFRLLMYRRVIRLCCHFPWLGQKCWVHKIFLSA
jgi:asparagine synthetase B (glutamine-hydrolysing)